MTTNLDSLQNIISNNQLNIQRNRDSKIELAMELVYLLGSGMVVGLVIGTILSELSPETHFIIAFLRDLYFPLYLDKLVEFAGFLFLLWVLNMVIPFSIEFILKKYMTIPLEITTETVNNKNLDLYVNTTDSTCYLVYNSNGKYKMIRGNIDSESSITLNVNSIQSSDSKGNLLENVKTHRYVKANASEYVYQRPVHFMRNEVTNWGFKLLKSIQ